MMRSLGVWFLLAAAATPTGDPLASARRLHGQVMVESSGALETVMLLAQLASTGPAATSFQADARARFALHASHPAVRETAALIGRGFGYPELALLSTMMSQAPYFVLADSVELGLLADRLPGGDKVFNLDRLHGYAKLLREFYWDNHVGRFLRAALPSYVQAVRRPPTYPHADTKVLVSLLAPVTTIQFERRTPRAIAYVVLGEQKGP